MDPVQPISDEQMPKLLAALAEAARADLRTAARFVPPRIGILEETAARRHQFVLGRRGVGKSTLLPKIESRGDQVEGAVVFVDIETLRDRPYPDVLIEMLIELLTGLKDRLKPDDWYRIDQLVARSRARRLLAKLTATLRRLLAQPQVAHAPCGSSSRAPQGCLPAGASGSAVAASASTRARTRAGSASGRRARRAAKRRRRWTAC